MTFKRPMIALALTAMVLSTTFDAFAAKNDSNKRVQNSQTKKERSVKKKAASKKSTGSKKKKYSKKNTKKKTAKTKKSNKKTIAVKQKNRKNKKQPAQVARRSTQSQKRFVRARDVRRKKTIVVRNRIIEKLPRNNIHVRRYRVSKRYQRPGLPMGVILSQLHEQGFRRLRVRDDQLPGYTIKACRHGNRVLLGVNRWGQTMWRERVGNCYRFGHQLNFGNNIVLKFNF